MKNNTGTYHESAIKHTTGEAVYINDMHVADMLYGQVIYSPHAHAKILKTDLDEALQVPGVAAILTYEDIPGKNQLGPVFHDEMCLAEKEVCFIGQAVLLIAADSKEHARQAAQKVNIQYQPLEAVTSLEEAIARQNRLHLPRKIETGNIHNGFQASDHLLEGSFFSGGQEHWYLETQSALAQPGEDRDVKVYASTQHPSETQTIVSEVLGLDRNEVEVETRRMGGAFGGKETQANHIAAWAALLARATQKPVLFHLNRDEDQIMTGKRHPVQSSYQVGFSKNGQIMALDIELHLDAGSSSDLTMAILERALFHVDNAYFIPHLRVIGNTWKTNKPSNTAFRGFGGPQGMAVIENIIDRIARFLGKEPLEIRKLNFYSEINKRTHYQQTIENNRLELIYDQIISTSDYYNRRKEIREFNHEHPYVKKGLALSPVKFGISFTTSFLNQAGALVNIYRDGTVLVNHGGTEMGQGLHTKILNIASAELGIDPGRIKVTATNTSKVPNTSATAASSGTDLNGMAVKNAIDQIKERLCSILDEQGMMVKGSIQFADNTIFSNAQPSVKISFDELIEKAYLNRISLSATGFYKTPHIHFDKEKGQGKPFHYFAFGMAASEVLLDTLTGETRVLRTDIVHDVGQSVNSAIDQGQIEGGFVQGMGWVTTEDLKYDEKGHLLNHSPDTYKIPTFCDIPDIFNVEILKNVPNPNTIRQSKAVGEPPFMLALSVWLAIKDAVSAVGDHRFEPDLKIPATNEEVLRCIDRINNPRFLRSVK